MQNKLRQLLVLEYLLMIKQAKVRYMPKEGSVQGRCLIIIALFTFILKYIVNYNGN